LVFSFLFNLQTLFQGESRHQDVMNIALSRSNFERGRAIYLKDNTLISSKKIAVVTGASSAIALPKPVTTAVSPAI
jgi:hypothetical protein